MKVPRLNRTRWLWATWLMVAALSAGMLLLSGCGSDKTLSPVIVQNGGDSPLMGSSRDGGSNCFESSGLVTSANGGVVSLGCGGSGNSISFAPGAVGQDVVISTQTCLVNGNSGNGFSMVELEFGPGGLTFNSPAKVVVTAASLNSLRSPRKHGTVKLYYYDPSLDEWLLQQESKIVKGKVTFTISHFSKFGISN